MSKTLRFSPSRQPWMTLGACAILSAVKKAGGEARFVGGAVRDALLGREVGDVDLAATLPPQKVMKALKAAGIKVVPTGLKHGTVTAVTGGRGYEVTTLRRDVETYGRHAKVAFTNDWKADAARRDFTFNALYADARGRIYDYFGGLEDLNKGRVRFIGRAEDRINEDVLRILRFFRFYAWYGRGAPDREAVQACKILAPKMRKLSAERVWKELKRMLEARDPGPAVRLMERAGVLAVALPEAKYIGRLETLVKLEWKFLSITHPSPNPSLKGRGTGRRMCSAQDLKFSGLRRLAALLGGDESAAESLARRLKMSRSERQRLVFLAVMPGELRGRRGAKALRRMIYEEKPEAVRDGVLLLAAAGAKTNLKAAFGVIGAWESPVFPIQGADILKLGVAPGPRVGEILTAVKDWWMARDFRPERGACLAEARRIVKSNN